MATIYQKLPLNEGQSFVARTYKTPLYETPLHQHDEYELILCTGTPGTVFLGNYIGRFQKGDIFLVGDKLPHWFRKNNEESIGEAIVVQFKRELFAENINSMPEFSAINELLKVSQSGIKLFGELKRQIGALLRRIEKQSSFKRYLTLLDCLHRMSESPQIEILTNPDYLDIAKKEIDRVRKVYEYSFEHFKDNITLSEIAELTHQSVSNFCKNFKRDTKKSYIEFLNDIRLNHACNKLKETDDPVTKICYDSGFRNWSNFSVQFKKRFKTSPSAYRKMWQLSKK